MDRRKPEQIVQFMHKADGELAQGKAIEAICREEQISLATYHRWKHKYGGLSAQDAKRLKALEIENAKLKRMLAESLLAHEALQEFLAHLPWREVPGKKV
jgi:transposase-like protein